MTRTQPLTAPAVAKWSENWDGNWLVQRYDSGVMRIVYHDPTHWAKLVYPD